MSPDTGSPSDRLFGWLRSAATLGVIVAPLLAASALCFGHDESSSEVTVELDALPPVLQGLQVDLHRTLAYQLVVENRTERVLEVIGSSDRPFLRIGPAGVEADLASPDWYRSYTALGVPIPSDVREKSGEPRWTKVSETPAWGWFDLRLRTERLQGSDGDPADEAHDEHTEILGRWLVPLRIGGETARLTGSFRTPPAPSGNFTARLSGRSEIRPGVRLRLLPGPQSGIYLENRSADAITILGSQGEPVLRIGPDGVEANVASPLWLATGHADVATPASSAAPSTSPRWQHRSPSPRFSWIDPRLNPPVREPPEPDLTGAKPDRVRPWEIPYLYRGERGQLRGVIEWIPAP